MYLYKYIHTVKSLVKPMILANSPFKMKRFHLNQSSWIAISHHPCNFLNLIFTLPRMKTSTTTCPGLLHSSPARHCPRWIQCLLPPHWSPDLLPPHWIPGLLPPHWIPGTPASDDARKSWWNSISWSRFWRNYTLYIYTYWLLCQRNYGFFLSKLASCIPWWRSSTFETWKFGSPALNASSVLGL